MTARLLTNTIMII